VQTEVRIRSTVGEGEEVTLEVLDDDGEVLETFTGTTDANGDVTIADVSIVDGAVSLRAAVDAGECGNDEDVVELEVTAGSGCELAIRETPLDIDFYAPLGVLNASVDTDAGTADFQGNVDVITRGGYEVELFVLSATGEESSVGTATADFEGDATFAVTLAQGRQTLRAVCSLGSLSSPSISTSVFVDTEAPSCAVTAPVAGTTITPALDANADLSDGVQLSLGGNAAGGDVEGEAATFVVTVDGADTTLAGSALDAAGDTSTAATIDPAAAPASAQVRLDVQDHAQNACSVTETYDVVYDGCAIAVEGPLGTVTSDVDADGTNGAQFDVDLQVDPACAGQTVTSDCGSNDPSGVVAGDGSLTLRLDWCGTVPCDLQDTCTFTVESGAGIETSVGGDFHYDDQAPTVGVQIFAPALSCGAQVTPASDTDASTPGVQVGIRVVSPLAADRQLEHTSTAGTELLDANGIGGDVDVTLDAGLNSFRGIATDGFGNSAQTGPCTITLSDIAVTFVAPAADGAVGASDGAVAGSDLTFDLCGRVSTAGAAVSISVDGGPALPATVVGIDWCRTLTLAASPPSYAIVATATSGPLMGSALLDLTVDLAPPDTIGDLAVIADTRQSLEATWTAPGDGAVAATSYLVKVSTTALSDANFDTTGEQVFTGAPQAPGTPESLRITPRRTGTSYWVGIAAVDGGGSRGTAAVVGPVIPLFDQTPTILPPDPDGDVFAGLAIAHGKFNDDDLWDVAVGAPGADGGASGAGAVYVYFGSASGISDTPDAVIDGGTDFGGFGFAVAAWRQPGATRDHIAIGEPYGDNLNGRVYVFAGGGAFGPGVYAPDDAAITIGVNSIPNYFTGGAIGWSLASLDFDGDASQDLAFGVAIGGGGNGGVAIVYGGSITTSQSLLSDTDTSQLGGAVVHLIDDPDPTTFDLFGNYVFNVGRTQGGTDVTEDLVISCVDGINHSFVYRGTASRPTATGVHARNFTVGLDVRIDYASADTTTEFGSSAGSISDINGDGARDLVISAYREGTNVSAGRVLIIDGNTVGTAGVALTSDTGVVITTINPAAGTALLGASIVNNASHPGADVDGDGFEDLIVSQRLGTGSGTARLLVWFGGSLPTGTVTSATAQHVITGPSTFSGGTPPFGGTPHVAIWAGDVNGDGLDDICWGDSTGNSLDGSIQVLWDDGM
jgi:hypothetical protein